jgi:LPS export ABC transporter permease LptG/LPS export ABC transporter permease LptF
MCQRNETSVGMLAIPYGNLCFAIRNRDPVASRFLMRRLDRYIFREILVPGLIAAAALTFIVFSTRRAGLLLDIIVRQSPTRAEIWAVLSALLPAILTVTLPMALLMGILTGFGRMSSDSEIIALRAAGISMRRILRPVLVLTTLVWAVTFMLAVWIAPQTTSNLRQIQTQLALKYSPIELRPRIFFEWPDGSWSLYINDPQRLGGGIQGQGILLVDTRNPDQPEFTLAESGNIVPINANQSLQITLTNSSQHSVDPKDARISKILSFPTTNTIAIPMPTPPGLPGEPPATEAPTPVLWDHVRSGSATLEETVEFHQRIALPFACFAFALMGLPLGVTTHRGGRSTGLVLSLILMFTYYLTFAGGTRTTGQGHFSPVLGAWLPNIGFSVLGILLLLRSDRRSENRLITAFSNAVEWVVSRVSSIKTSGLDVRGWAYTARYRLRLFRLLDIYVLRGFWFFFAIVLSVFASLFIVVTLFELLPDIIRNDVAAGTVVIYFVFLMPQIIYWVTPLAVLLATLINLGSLTKTNEVLAVKAGAISLYRLSLPLILMGALLSGMIYVLDDHVLPSTNRRQDEYHNVIKGRPPQTYRDPVRKLMMGSANQIYHYSFFDAQSNTFANLTILTIDPQTFQPRERLFAKRATWREGGWTFEEGWLREFSEDHRPAGERMFESLSTYSMDAPDYFRREVPEADQMNYAQLERYVEDLRRSGLDVDALTVDLYRKLSFPMVSFIMALIGVPFSFKTGRKGAFFGIGLCLAVGIVYWSTFQLFGKLGGINQLSPIVAAWFPNLIFGASGFWMMLRLKT